MSEPVRAEGAEATGTATAPIVVKKYANRRLYDTESSSYITLDNLAHMIRTGRDFVVYDAKTGEDITRSVLTQIIVEEENKGRAMLPTSFLRQLICFYGDSLQALVPRYLEQAMGVFARQQEQMRLAMQQSMGNFFPFNMEDIGRQNLALMERALNLFTPFYRQPSPAADSTRAESERNADQEVAGLRAQVAELTRQLAEARQQTAAPRPASEAAGAMPESKSVARKRGGITPT